METEGIPHQGAEEKTGNPGMTTADDPEEMMIIIEVEAKKEIVIEIRGNTGKDLAPLECRGNMEVVTKVSTVDESKTVVNFSSSDYMPVIEREWKLISICLSQHAAHH